MPRDKDAQYSETLELALACLSELSEDDIEQIHSHFCEERASNIMRAMLSMPL